MMMIHTRQAMTIGTVLKTTTRTQMNQGTSRLAPRITRAADRSSTAPMEAMKQKTCQPPSERHHFAMAVKIKIPRVMSAAEITISTAPIC